MEKRKTEETDQHNWFTHRLILTSENINKIISVYNSSTQPEHIFILAFLYFVWYFYVQQQIFEEEKIANFAFRRFSFALFSLFSRERFSERSSRNFLEKHPRQNVMTQLQIFRQFQIQ